MKVLHYYDQQNDLQARYVRLLMELCGTSAQMSSCNTLSAVKSELRGSHWDILHIHGCWLLDYAKASVLAHRLGTRTIITPHGELEPWILKNRQWQEKMPKTLLYQRQTIQKAYVVIAMGDMERESLVQLGWNPRIETVRNALVTRSITIAEMNRQLLNIYRKVMDSNVYELMNDKTREALFLLLKAGVCGDACWLQNSTLPALPADSWRQLMIYVRYEQLDSVMRRGLHLLRTTGADVSGADIDVQGADCYLPAGYKAPESIASVIGNKFASEEERLLATFKYLHRQHIANRLAMTHLLELEREIREHDIDEEHLTETLQEHRLLPFVSRLMGLLAEFTGLEEGMMPITALNDRQTQRLKDAVTGRLDVEG